MQTVYLGTARPFATPATLQQRLIAAAQHGAQIKRTFMAGSVVFHAYWPQMSSNQYLRRHSLALRPTGLSFQGGRRKKVGHPRSRAVASFFLALYIYIL